MSENRFSRTALYDLVWQEAISSIAVRLAVRSSDVVRACEAASIPRPPNGYWMKLSFGKAAPKPPLPSLAQGQSDFVEITGKPQKKNRPPNTEVPPDHSRNADAEPTHTPKPLHVHPIVRATEKAVRGQKSYARGGLVSPGLGVAALDIQVAKDSVDRTLRILNAIIQDAAAQGIKLIEIGDQHSTQVAFQVFEETVSVSVREKLTRELIEPANGKVHYWKEYRYTPTGVLELRLTAPYGMNKRSTWRDGKIQTVEQFVPEIVTSIREIGAAWKQHRIEAEERSRRWAEEERRSRERERQFALKKARRKRLMKQLKAWRLSRKLVNLANAVEALTPSEDDVADWSSWIAWIRAEAEGLDPLATGRRPWHEWAEQVRHSTCA